MEVLMERRGHGERHLEQRYRKHRRGKLSAGQLPIQSQKKSAPIGQGETLPALRGKTGWRETPLSALGGKG